MLNTPPPVFVELDGYYSETHIENRTSKTIRITRQNGTHEDIDPISQVGASRDFDIVIRLRTRTGAAYSGNNMLIVPIYKSIEIPENELNSGPYYSVELNLMFSRTDSTIRVDHPQNKQVQHKAMVRAMANIKAAPTVGVAINYPHQPDRTVFCYILGRICKLTTESYYSAGEPSVEVFFKDGDTCLPVLSQELPEFGKLDAIVVPGEDNFPPLILGTSETLVKDKLEEYNTNHRVLTMAESDEYFANKLAQARKRAQADIDTLTVECTKLQDALHDKEIELVKANTSLASVQGIISGEGSLKKLDAQAEMIEYKRDEQAHKSSRAAMSAGTEATKFISTAAKVGIGIAAGVAAVLLMPGSVIGGLLSFFG